MCTILLSINPEHVTNIFSGAKLYEYRKTICKRHVDKIVIYSTNPVKKVVGEAMVTTILTGKPEEIWKMTSKKAGIEKKFFDKYYDKKSIAVAFKLSSVVEYNEPKDLEEYGIKKAPQSYQYI